MSEKDAFNGELLILNELKMIQNMLIEISNKNSEVKTSEKEISPFVLIEQKFGKASQFLDTFIEKPTLLDKSLEEICEICFNIVGLVSLDDQKPKLKPCLQFLYLLCRIRGTKVVSKFFPKDSSNLEDIVDHIKYFSAELIEYRKLIHNSSEDDVIRTTDAPWKSLFTCLVWLYNLLLLPFDISTIDTDSSIVSSILSISLKGLTESSAVNEVSALVLARLFSRKDILEDSRALVNSFFSSSIELFVENTLSLTVSFETSDELFSQSADSLSTNSASLTVTTTSVNKIFLRRGVLMVIVRFLKVADRVQVLQVINEVGIDSILKFTQKANKELSSVGEVKLFSKLVQRLCLIILPPSQLKNKVQGIFSKDSANSNSQDNVFKVSVAATDLFEHLEPLIEHLLYCLRNGNTVVRWSAAKGIGRIFACLPPGELRIELLRSLTLNEACHGSLLAIAELTRQGLIGRSDTSEEDLTKIFSTVNLGLFYEEQKTSKSSVGHNIRDAACYFFWAFARSRPVSELLAYEDSFVLHLCCVALFDIELNCRRCACAALQEYLGRIGNEILPGKEKDVQIKQRMKLIESLNFFSVNSLDNCYLQVSLTLVKNMPILLSGFVAHLQKQKLFHWNSKIRELASKCVVQLQNVGEFENNELFVQNLSELLIDTSSLNVEKHGALLYLSELLKSCLDFSDTVQTCFRNVVMKMEKQRCYRGKNGELIRMAVLNYIATLFSFPENKLKISFKTVCRLIETIQSGLSHSVLSVQKSAHLAARKALNFVETHKLFEEQNQKVFLRNLFVDANIKAKQSLNVGHRRGSCFLLSCFSPYLLERISSTESAFSLDLLSTITLCCLRGNTFYRLTMKNFDLQKILEKVEYPVQFLYTRNKHGVGLASYTITDEANDPVLRRECVRTLALYLKQHLKNLENPFKVLSTFILTLSLALEDYDSDERGDVGSWVRMEALRSAELLLKAKYVNSLLKTEDRLQTFREILDCSIVVQVFERNIAISSYGKQVLIDIGAAKDSNLSTQVVSQEEHYASWVNLLYEAKFKRAICFGFISSVSDLTKSIEDGATKALDIVFGKNLLSAKDFFSSLVHYCQELKIYNSLRTFIRLFSDSVALESICTKDVNNFIKCLQVEIQTSSFRVLSMVSSTAITLLKIVEKSNCASKEICLRVVLNLLSHKFARIRQATSDTLYLALLSDENLLYKLENKRQSLLELLLNTQWAGLDMDRKGVVSEVAEIMGIKKKVGVVKKAKSLEIDATEEDGYSNLVAEISRN